MRLHKYVNPFSSSLEFGCGLYGRSRKPDNPHKDCKLIDTRKSRLSFGKLSQISRLVESVLTVALYVWLRVLCYDIWFRIELELIDYVKIRYCNFIIKILVRVIHVFYLYESVSSK